MEYNFSAKESLLKELSDSYMEKIFYFCLRKTGDSYEAEDLSSEIILCILSELQKGVIPKNFPAWVWQIARNRYARWSDMKTKNSTSIAPDDIGNFELESDITSPDSTLIHNEEMNLLRRELAFVSADYRNILVAHYIEDRSVKDIARSFDIPEGTVKYKLYRARNLLKEGMDMAREFGPLSYRPENIEIHTNGLFGRLGEPEIYFYRLLPKNIMLSAYRCPQTAEELAMEVGVALPYIEEEIKALLDVDLLRKDGKKYETNFAIISAQALNTIIAHQKGLIHEFTKALTAYMEYTLNCLCENGIKWHGGYQNFEDMKWTLLMLFCDEITDEALKRHIPSPSDEALSKIDPAWGYTKRKNGGAWDVVGLETKGIKRKAPEVGLHGCYSPADANKATLTPLTFHQYRFEIGDICQKTPAFLKYEEGEALEAVARGSYSSVNERILKNLTEHGYLREENSEYKPTFLVLFKDNIENALSPSQKEKQLCLKNEAVEIAWRHYEFTRETVLGEIPEHFKDNTYQIDHACSNVFLFRGALIKEAVDRGYISLCDEHDDRPLGAYLII